MSNDSSTGGYLSPALLPDGVVFRRLLGSLISGITGIPGALCRPLWQPNPPAQPDIFIDWVGFGITKRTGDFNAEQKQGTRTITVVTTPADPDADPPVEEETEQREIECDKLRRYEEINVQASFYGPSCEENALMLRDGLEVAQNREALYGTGVSIAFSGDIIHVPELINDHYYDRADFNFTIRREINRDYAVLSFSSAAGILNAETIAMSFAVHR